MRKNIYGRIVKALSSDRFFLAVLALLVFQALWVALSGGYPMAYDEQNHIGLVKLYANHLWPFWSSEPTGPATYSVVSRDPSYMYHWLMSWPYHVFGLFIKDDAAMTGAFRLVSIGMFTAGVVVYRRLLLQTQVSKALIHVVFAIFVLTPTVPFLAGQMNYDNLLFLLVAIVLLSATRIISDIREDKLNISRLAVFVSVALLTSLVKFPFLAILLAIGVWMLAVLFRRHGQQAWDRLTAQLRVSAKKLSKPAAAGLVLLVLLSGGMFAERYGVNMIRYHTPLPECDQVLDVERCMAFGPWKRNYDIYQSRLAGTLPPVDTGIVHFSYTEWFMLITWQFFYTLNGPISNFAAGAPLAVPYYIGIYTLEAGILLVLIFWRSVLRRPFMKGLLFVGLFYVLVLWAQNYSDFLRLHVATAIQARYIVLVLPILYLAMGLAYARLLRFWPPAKALLAGLVVVALLTQGGGIGVFILRSDKAWWWRNQTVVRANQTAQSLLWKIQFGN